MSSFSSIPDVKIRKKHRFFSGIYFKVMLMLAVILSLATLEVMLALHFKADLKDDFIVVSNFDDNEREYLRAILSSSELAHEVSLPRQDMVFLKVGLWMRRLRELSQFEEKFVPQEPDDVTFSQLAEALNRDVRDFENDEEFKDFSHNVKRKLLKFNEQLKEEVRKIRETRSQIVLKYGEKSDLYSIILLLGGAAGVAIIFFPSLMFFRGVLATIEKVKNQTVLIAEGEYDKRLPADRDDEIGELLVAINTMAASLQVREQENEDFQHRMFQQDKMYTIGSFASGIAHEVGNPIQAMMALTGQAIEELVEDDSKKTIDRTIENLSLVMEQIERLSRVVGDVREYSHTSEKVFEYASINDVITSAIRIIRFDKRSDRVEISSILDEDDVPLYLNIDHLTQLVINLLVNAVDAIEHDNGKIIVATKFEKDEAVLRVSDNGKGMSENEQLHAFEEFFTTKEKGKGTGLGLSVCKRIVQECNGKITVSSVPEKGTTFSVTFPITDMGRI